MMNWILFLVARGMKMNKAAIYVRLSQEDDNKSSVHEDSQSIINQKLMLLDYCKEKSWEVYDIYNDDDYKGSDRNRPAFNRLLQDAREKKFDIVLCKSQSRFTRELEIVEKYLHGLFPLWGIRFISLIDNADTFNKGNKKARQINGLINEWYLEDMSDNIKETFKTKCINGKHIGSFACYGYLKDPKIKGHLIIDETAAKVVRTIFNLYLKGLGQLKIAQYLNENKIPNPTTYKQLMGLNYKNRNIYHSWSASSVRMILINEMYIGNMVQHRKTSVSYKSKKQKRVAKDEWIIKENTHDAIIDRNQWDEVQSLLHLKRRSNSQGLKNKYAGKLRCEECGSILVSNTWNQERYFRCRLRLQDKSACQGTVIKEKVLDKVVENKFRELKDLVNYNYLITNILEKKILKEKNELEKLKEVNRQKINRIEGIIKKLSDDLVNGIISEKMYLELIKDFKGKLEKSEQENKEIEDQLKNVKQEGEYKKVIDSIFDVKMIKNIAVYFIERIEIRSAKNKRIKIYWKI